MQYSLKKPAILLVAILVSFLFVFAANKSVGNTNMIASSVTTAFPEATSSEAGNEEISSLYAELNLQKAGLEQEVFAHALNGLKKLENEGVVRHNDVITIIDFSQPSSQKRLYIVDLDSKRLLFNTLVAHGKNTGTLWAKSFSNQYSSLKSSPGFYTTAETYMGENGYSMRLDGQEKGINDNARSRAVVMHGAAYATESTVQSLGFLGRSWGCPAVPMAQHKNIINTIKGGSCLFIYSPDQSYQEKSTFLNS